MSESKMTRSAYEALIGEDCAYLDRQQPSLARDHIRVVLRWSIGAQYDADPRDDEIATLRAENERLTRELSAATERTDTLNATAMQLLSDKNELVSRLAHAEADAGQAVHYVECERDGERAKREAAEKRVAELEAAARADERVRLSDFLRREERLSLDDANRVLAVFDRGEPIEFEHGDFTCHICRGGGTETVPGCMGSHSERCSHCSGRGVVRMRVKLPA